jgi:hypothetical protein
MNDEDAAAEAIASLTSSNDGDGEGGLSKSDAVVVDVEPAEALSTGIDNAKGSTRRKYKKRVKDPEHNFPVQPRVIQVVHKPKRYVNQ